MIMAGLVLLAMPESPAQEPEKRSVLVLTMSGAISPAFSDYLEQGLAKARELNAQLVVIKLDTPGGLLTSTRDMVSAILESDIPVAVWVTPSGAHAASAGTFLLYAAHIAAMDSGTNVGAATPIQMGGPMGPAPPDDKNDNEDNPIGNSAHERKAIEDTAAFIRGLAELRGRNAEWGELAVTEAKSLTATEALEANVIDLIATSQDDLLNNVDGKAIALKNAPTLTLDLADAPVVDMKPDIRTHILSFLSDPNVAFILLTIGIYGFILEFYNPGTMIPATVGAICLIAGLFALNILPVNMAGVILLVVGILLMIAEALVPSFGILGIGGVAAFILGATFMFDQESMPGLVLDMGLVWGMALLGVLIVLLVVWLAVNSFKQKATTGQESLIGHSGKIVAWGGEEGHIHIRGETWSARTESGAPLEPGAKAEVVAIDGLTLVVR